MINPCLGLGEGSVIISLLEENKKIEKEKISLTDLQLIFCYLLESIC